MKRKLLFAVAALFGMSMSAQIPAGNIISNADFSTVGALAAGATDRYAVGEPWVSNVSFANMGIRVMASSAATEGGNVLVWRGSGNSNYISQPVAAEAGAAYEVTIKQVASGNANANFNVGIGTAAGKYDVAFGIVRLGTNNDGVKTVKLLMPTVVDATDLYFTFANTTSNSASSGSDPVSQIDYIAMEVIDALPLVKENAIASLPTAGEGIFQISQDDLDAAKADINNASTRAEVEDILAGLVVPALSGEWNVFNVSGSNYLGADGSAVKLLAEPVAIRFEKATSGYYIKAGETYINMKGGNTWSMSADAEAKTAWNFTLADGKYTISGPNGMIGADASATGSTLYGNKAAANNGYWTITKALSGNDVIAQEILNIINGVEIPTANVGDDAFQYNELNVGIVQGHKVMGEEATASDLVAMAEYRYGEEGAAAYLEAFKAGIQSDIENMNTLNKPENGQKFAMVLTFDGWTYDNKAMTYIANGRADAGLYNIQYNSELNLNYAQAFTMTWVEGNKYKMSQIDAEGQVRYICTGVPYGGNTAQIRTILDAEKALLVEVRPTATEGKYNLWNTEANQYIGSQDQGVYTVNSHIDFNIVEAQPGKGDYINIWPEIKYATICSPHAIHLENDDITAVYTVDGVDENGTTLVMTELTLENNTIPANTPVLLYAENGASNQHAGFGTAYAGMNLTKGLLTGVYADTEAPVGSYVMQNHDGVVGFYQVSEEEKPLIWAYKCYLTAPAASEAKAFTFGQATAIETVEALTAGKAQIYDMNGRQLQKMQKGINIVNGVKVLVK